MTSRTARDAHVSNKVPLSCVCAIVPPPVRKYIPVPWASQTKHLEALRTPASIFRLIALTPHDATATMTSRDATNSRSLPTHSRVAFSVTVLPVYPALRL